MSEREGGEVGGGRGWGGREGREVVRVGGGERRGWGERGGGRKKRAGRRGKRGIGGRESGSKQERRDGCGGGGMRREL